jgi:transposase-like protein
MDFRKILQKDLEIILEKEKEMAIDGVDEIMRIVYEGVMKAERTAYLSETDKENKANGYYFRMVKSTNKYVSMAIPRDRFSMFKPVFLEAANKMDENIQDAAFMLYSKGMSTRDIEEFVKKTFGKHYSPSAISTLTKNFEKYRKQWQNRAIDSEYFFISLDAVFIFVRRGETVKKEAFYIVMGLDKELRRDILGIYNFPEESAEGWNEVLQDLKIRGLKKCLIFAADGLKGLDEVVHKQFPQAEFQRCLVHKMRNILTSVRSEDKKEIAEDFRKVFVKNDSSYTEKEARRKLEAVIEKWKSKYPGLKKKFEIEEISHYFSYLKFPATIQSMLCTTNWLERLNREIRRVTKNKSSFPNPDSALNLIAARIIDLLENGYLKHPLSSCSNVRNELLKMLEEQK